MTIIDSTEGKAPGRAGVRAWSAVVAVAVGIFALVTAEQLPVGLLAPIGSELHVSEGTAGLMVTVPGLVAALSAPLLPVAIGRLDRRIVLAGLIGLMVAAHAVSALAPGFGVLLASRVLVGVAIGGFWALAGGLAPRLVPGPAVPRAMSLIFGGVAAAEVLGVPAGTLIGGWGGWRAAFAVLGGLGALVLIALVAVLPPLPARAPVRLSALGVALRNPGVRTAVLVTGLLVTGHFTAYTFVGPALEDVSGLGQGAVGPLLLGYGVAGIVGNFVVAPFAGRDVRKAAFVIAVALAAAMALFPLVGTSRVTGVVMLLAWGLAFGGVSVGMQTWILRAAPDGAEAATSVNTSMFNFAIALGAFAGGVVVDAAAVPGALWLGGAIAAVTLVVVARATAPGKAPSGKPSGEGV
ncbi:MFS transporter [Actinomadura sp. LOL_016]|uniref:MFS transporter n=1 Tax=unclassified Actinomadura TaxID=2626254 RepID=UPI003A7F6E60